MSPDRSCHLPTHEPKASSAELYDLIDDGIHASLSQLLAVGPPDGAERAMLRASAHRLNRAPHIPPLWQQFPPCRDEPFGIEASAIIDLVQTAVRSVVQHERPHHITIAFDHGVRAAETLRLAGIKCRVNATKDDGRPAIPRERADLVAAKRVAGVNPDPDNVAGLHAADVKRLECFVRYAPAGGRVKWESRRRGRTAIAV